MTTRTSRALRRLAVGLVCLMLCTGYFGCGGGGSPDEGNDPGIEPASLDATDLAPRKLPVKPTSTLAHAGQVESAIFVKFLDDLGVVLADGLPLVPEELLDLDLASALDLVQGGDWLATHQVEPSKLDALRETAQRNLGQVTADFRMQFTLLLPEGADRAAVCDAFNRSAAVELAWPVPIPSDPLPTSFENWQIYLLDGTNGIGAESMWENCAVRGAGINVCDIERDWNSSHVDLPAVTLLGSPGVDSDGTPVDDNNHGTAVMGVMASLDNGFGTTGACHDADFFFAAVRTNPGAVYNVAGAILTAAAAFGPGDVILIEQHMPGPNWPGGNTQFGYVPMEWDLGVYLAIVTATGLGITVVEAAGNGTQNLDDAIYGGWFSPANDSGAIMVGAGASAAGSDVPRSRLGFSNYGATVDLQGYGEMVTTTGYGTFYGAEGQNLWYTATFNGTSSASPIVTSACALLQSAVISRTGTPLTPTQVRDTLQTNGSPQQAGANPVTENIGPLPDVPASIGCLTLTCPGDTTLECTSPSGVTHMTTITVSDPSGAALEVDVTINGVWKATATFAASPPSSGGSFGFSHDYACCSTHTVEVEARSVIGGIETCTFDVTVEDTTDPTITCPGDVTVECDGAPGRVVHFTGAAAATATDVCDPNPTITYVPPSGSTFMLGTTPVFATATDAAGNSDVCSFNVVVEDTTPPVVSASARRLYLFLPRNGMIDVVLERSVYDVCDPSPTMQVEVWSSQPDTGAPFTPDGAVVASDLQLRAEVDLAAVDPGRVFLVLVTATDASSNVGRKSTWVIVPKTATAQDIVGARNIAVAAQSDYDSSSTIPAGWTQVLAPTPLP